MPIARPDLLCLGGEEALSAYQREFESLYFLTPIVDRLQRTIEFPPDSVYHVCYKKAGSDPHAHLPRKIWVQDRAERIPWILLALQRPDYIRVDFQNPNNLIHILIIGEDLLLGQQQEYYCAIVKPSLTRRKVVEFVTAYNMEDSYFWRAQRGGRLIYPERAPKEKQLKDKKKR